MLRRHFERIFSLLMIVGLLGVIFWQSQRRSSSVINDNVNGQELPTSLPSQSDLSRVSEPRPPEPIRGSDLDIGDALEQAEARIVELERQLAELTRPLENDVRSATVNTNVGNDETLITGGYQTPDGLTHFLFLRPERHELPDGRIAVKLQGAQYALTPEQLGRSELTDLTSTAGNTLQHGQAWKNDEVTRVVGEMEKNDSGDRFSAPSVITMPGQRVEVSVGEEFSYNITPKFLDDDSGFQLRMRMEHVPAVNSATDP